MRFSLDHTRLVARVEVSGRSMVPTLEPGDRVLVLRRRRLGPGDLVAVADPRRPERVLVKRVAGVEGDMVTVLGDNPAESTDSRTFGAVHRRSVLGVAVYRYAPSPKRLAAPGRRIG